MSQLTILIPLDGSETAERAFLLLRALKPLADVRVRALCVAEASTSADVERHQEEIMSAYLGPAATRLQQQSGVPVEPILRTGVPFEQILEEAHSQDVNILMMSTHGWTMGQSDRLGSVADKVVRGASCPTLLIGPHAGVPTQIERITVPLDGSALAAQALPIARSIAEKVGARLRLIRAIEMPLAVETDSTGNLSSSALISLEQPATRYLSQVAGELGANVPVETAVLDGPAAHVLVDDLRHNRPELVIMTSHGRRGFVRWMLGSVTERIVRADVPVLVLRPVDSVGDRLASLVHPAAAVG